MTRDQATQFCRSKLEEHNLGDWHIKLVSHMRILGVCDYKSKTIFLSIFHLDTHPDPEIENTVLHEIAHALTPGHMHDEVWQAKAREIGCTSVSTVSHLSYSPEVIDAIRSGASVEVTFETEVIHRPKYRVTRLQDKCPICGKVAKTNRESFIHNPDDTKPDRKLVFLECGHLISYSIPKGTPFHKFVSNGWKDEVKSCNHEWDKNQCKLCGEYRLFPFQVEGAQFIEAALAVNKGAGVFDEMGLGKTVQVIADIVLHEEERTPVIFIVKSAIKYQWFKELLRWGGPKFLPQVIQSSKDWIIPNLKCYVISYDMLVSKERKGKNGQMIKQGFDVNRLITLNPKTIVLDECQQIKNPDASRTQEVRKLCKNCKVIPLSGTPWKNRGSEYFTVLNMLDPMKFRSHNNFIDQWVDIYWDGNRPKQGGIRNVKAFREYVKDIIIRREVSEVMSEMPDVNRTLFYAQLNEFEQKTYDKEVSEFVAWYVDAEANDELNKFSAEGNILAKLARMRHITGLAKIPATIEFVKDFIESTGRKITIFVHHKDVGEILYNECQSIGVPVYKLTAEQDSMTRTSIVDTFNSTESCILIASTLASGEGINLQTCGDAVLHERQWNPQNEDQAAPGRFRRIGSKFKSVNVVFMTAQGTVDEILANLVEKKRVAFHTAMNKSEMSTFNQLDFAKELAKGIVENFVKNNSKRS